MSTRTAFHRPIRAKRTEYRGRIYPSKMQAKRAMELDALMAVNEVAWWLPEVSIDLGEDHRYRVDFLVGYMGPGPKILRVHAEDVKAIETREFRRHKRLWRKYGPFPLHVITRAGTEVITKED